MAERTDWNPVLRAELAKPYWAELQQFVAAERARTAVYPPHEDVFAALHLTPYADVKVVILGQDPYHGAGQAHGLCFSVRPGVPPPPSLVNIFKELHADLGIDPPAHGCLDAWARQGVLLLNATLTVRARQAASHQGKGWETFTDEVIRAVNAKPERVVFILWGASARKKRGLDRHQPPRRSSSRPTRRRCRPTTASSAAGPSPGPTPPWSRPAASRSTGVWLAEPRIRSETAGRTARRALGGARRRWSCPRGVGPRR